MSILVNCIRLAFPLAAVAVTHTASRSVLASPSNFRSPAYQIVSIIQDFLGLRLRLERHCRKLYFTETMGKGGYYAVARGRVVGIYQTWDECKAQVTGFPNARYKKFPTNTEAESFIDENRGTGAVSKLISKPTSSSAKDMQASSGSGGGKDLSSWISNNPPPTSKTTMFTDPLPKRVGLGQQSKLSAGGMRAFTTTAGLNKRALKVTEDIVTGRKRAKLEKDHGNSNVDRSNFTFDDEGYVVVYTDGACKANGKGKSARAGIGVWFEDNHSLNISERVKGRQTNNTAEIQAAERAILQAKSAGVDKLTLKTDSQFTINCVTKWLQNWKRNGWKLRAGQDVKNREDLEKLDKAITGMEIKWSYVKAHCGNRGNEAADRLAVLGSENNT